MNILIFSLINLLGYLLMGALFAGISMRLEPPKDNDEKSNGTLAVLIIFWPILVISYMIYYTGKVLKKIAYEIGGIK